VLSTLGATVVGCKIKQPGHWIHRQVFTARLLGLVRLAEAAHQTVGAEAVKSSEPQNLNQDIDLDHIDLDRII